MVYNDKKYAYVHNLQGDIVAILDSAGSKAVQYVGGLGETVDALRAMNVIDDSVDVVKSTENTLNVISDAATLAGITNDFDRRETEWADTRHIRHSKR